MNDRIGRRLFFKLAGSGIAGYFLLPGRIAAASVSSGDAPLILKSAKNVIYILFAGAPSQIDTFDLKVGPWTPEKLDPTTINGIDFPQGLLPTLANQLDKIGIVRSCLSTALVHSLLQTWNQIARSPLTGMGKIAPNLGSVVALEFESQKPAGKNLPTFVALNTPDLASAGYFPTRYSAFNINADPAGLAFLENADGADEFAQRFQFLSALNDAGPNRSEFMDLTDFYGSAKRMMLDPSLDPIFQFSTDEHTQYGSSTFGDSCIVARNLIRADRGTRYIQITLPGWDHHANIYSTPQLFTTAKQLDLGLGTLLADLVSSPGSNGQTLLDDTLIVAKGEFGRTVGPLTSRGGRDHYGVHAAILAGGGVHGGKAIGATTDSGATIEDPGWSQGRPVTAEDVAATIYSALGINYRTVRHDDPLGRGFEYVPFSNLSYQPQPILELF